jgi:hypothetical protein
MKNDNRKWTMTPYLDALGEISKNTREEIGRATAEFLRNRGLEFTLGQPDDHLRAMFDAALDGMADLIQYGQLGPAAIDRLHRARELCNIPLSDD